MLFPNYYPTGEGKAMNRKFAALILARLTLITAGCEKMNKSASAVESASRTMLFLTGASAASSQRYIAEHDKLEIIASKSELQKSWESAITFCATIQCEVISSSITTPTGNSAPTGDISLRVAPEDLKKLWAYLDKLGKISQHTTEREDKTIVVADSEAKIKNLTSFRDSLRAMLAKPSATVQDLVEIQKQLTDTQSELDAETTQRKMLANETEKVAVEISFRVEGPGGSRGGFALIWNALRESGSVLGDSTASLITTIVAVIPWLILVLPAVWLLAKVWGKLKLRRNRIVPSPQSTTAT
jgi:Domain of unknown function (DUF4349)